MTKDQLYFYISTKTEPNIKLTVDTDDFTTKLRFVITLVNSREVLLISVVLVLFHLII